MRDITFLVFFLFCLGLTFRYPYAGILTWAWLSFMSPHQNAYSFALSIPFNMIVSVFTIAMLVAKGGLEKLPRNIVTTVMLFMTVWTGITTAFGYDVDWSYRYFDLTLKTFMFVFLVMATSTTKVRIHALTWVMVASLAYYGVKGGIFCIIHGGNYKVWGPTNTIISDNNQLALAMVMILPMANYLRLQSSNRMIRLCLSCAMALQVLAILSSYSRGSTIALAMMLIMFWWSSKNRVITAIAGVAAIGIPLSMMPDNFWERMNSVNEAAAGKDESFQGRVDAWYVATAYATDHFPIGAGFYAPQLPELFDSYLPGHTPHAAHSIYFQVLGEHGFPALFAYLIMLAAGIFNFQYVAREARPWPGWSWMVDLARMSRIALLSFYLGAAALSMAYYDVMLTLLALSAVTRKMVDTHKKELGLQSRVDIQRPMVKPVEGMENNINLSSPSMS